MDGVFSLHPDRSQMRDQVFEAIRDAIVSMRLEPGERLRESHLVEELGVSKTPIREALVRLEELDLVEIEKYKGAVVRGYTRTDLIEIYGLRELLEGACARAAAERISPEDLQRLRSIVDESEEAHDRGDTERVIELFDDFDRLMTQQTDNSKIHHLMGELADHMARIGLLTATIPGRVEDSIKQHREVADAIAAGDGDRAEEAMRAHVQSVLEDHLSMAEDGHLSKLAGPGAEGGR